MIAKHRIPPTSAGWRWIARLFAAVLAIGVACQAQAATYSNTSTTPIVDSTNCASTVTRTFNVSDTDTIGDVNVGIILSHS